MCLQIMVPYQYTEFLDTLKDLVNKKVVPMNRIDDAVSRILRVKFAMGLFEDPLGDSSLENEIGSQVSHLRSQQNTLLSLSYGSKT